jgi:hypothetical protein
MRPLDPDLVAIVAIAAAGVALLALLLALVLALRLRRLRKGLQRALGEHGDDLVEVLGSHSTQLEDARRAVGELGTRLDDLREHVRSTISRVGLVRYDAFDDMGGALSFSTALLDEHGDGLVISAINGRTETRCYGKALINGASEHHLSDEELAAIEAAVEGRPPAIVAPEGRRRRRRSA